MATNIREHLAFADEALEGLGASVMAIAGDNPDLAAPFRAFVDVLENDARIAQAAIRLALAMPAISSQLIDNLNASIHVRALLTDLFLVDEALKSGQDMHDGDGVGSRP